MSYYIQHQKHDQERKNLINWTLAKLKNRESEKDTVKRMKGQTID
jgi:hypothetical protein